MKKYSLLLIGLQLMASCALLAQTNHSVAKPPVKTAAPKTETVTEIAIKDTFEWNVQTTLRRLKAYILDDTKSSGFIVGNYIATSNNRPVYSAIINMPDAIESKVIREKVNRAADYVDWEWKTVFFRTGSDQELQRTKVENIIQHMPAMKGGNEKNKVVSITTSVSPSSYVELSVHFVNHYCKANNKPSIL